MFTPLLSESAAGNTAAYGESKGGRRYAEVGGADTLPSKPALMPRLFGRGRASSYNRFAVGTKIALTILAVFLPIFFLPRPFGIEFGREMMFAALILCVFVLWLVSLLAAGEIRWRHSPILYAAAILAVAMGISVFASPAPWVSVFFADVPAERLSMMILGLLLMLVAGNVLRRREEGETLLFALIFSGGVSAGLTAVQLLFDRSLLRAAGVAADAIGNVVGTMNGLVLIYTALFVITAGILCSSAALYWKAWVRWALGATAVLFLLDLLLINFRTAWIALLGASVVLFGLFLTDGLTMGAAGVSRFRMRHWAMACIVMASIVMLMVRGRVIPGVVIPPEVSPSLRATLSITSAAFKEGPLKVFFGSGPGTFGLLWARHKDPSINQTIFWGTRFNQGQSWAVTLLSTVGVIGAASFMLFVLTAFATFLRMLLGARAHESGQDFGADNAESWEDADGFALARALFGGFIAMTIALFLYPVTLSFLMLFFLLIGVLSVVIAYHEERRLPDMASDVFSSEAAPEESGDTLPDEKSFWSVTERAVRFSAPWSIFVSSLVMIFFIALGAVGLWTVVNHSRAAFAVERGIAAANRGNLDGAMSDLKYASEIEPRDFRTLNLLVQAHTEKVRRILQRAAQGENVQQEFQTAVSAGVVDAQRLTELYQEEPNLWRVQAALYELVIPYIQGSERFATAAYQKAAEREPANPEIYVQWGRAGLAFADRIAIAANQAQGKEQEELLKARTDNLQQIIRLFQRAIEVKQDFAPAHFLLSQTALRLGNIDAAIQSVENAKAAAPFDTGIAFQLGLLYYQKNDLTRAQAEFERAISLNENYSNARYFLGLIYDRHGGKEKAIDQFRQIEKLNPDNAEVKHILVNLSAGNPALDGIVPPAAPPEKRKDTPVKQEQAR